MSANSGSGAFAASRYAARPFLGVVTAQPLQLLMCPSVRLPWEDKSQQTPILRVHAAPDSRGLVIRVRLVEALHPERADPAVVPAVADVLCLGELVAPGGVISRRSRKVQALRGAGRVIRRPIRHLRLGEKHQRSSRSETKTSVLTTA